MVASAHGSRFAPGEVYWAGSDEWPPWINRPRIRILEELPSHDFRWLLRVEALTEPPEEFLFGVPRLVERRAAGAPVGALVFAPEPRQPWDGERPLGRSDLVYQGEATLGRRRDELPFMPEEKQQRRRKGWAF